MGRTQVFDWFRRFKEGRTSVKSDPRSGRPSTSRNEEMIAKVRTIVRSNRILTVRGIADDCGISVGSGDAILNENDRKNGGMATGSCTTTMRPPTLHILCSRFWTNTAPLSCGSRHTHQISHRVTFCYSQSLRKFWKDTDLRQRRTSNEIRRRHYWHPERVARKMFPSVEETLGEVCSCGRELCWRQLGLKPRKPYLLHVQWSVRILFEQTS